MQWTLRGPEGRDSAQGAAAGRVMEITCLMKKAVGVGGEIIFSSEVPGIGSCCPTSALDPSFFLHR